MSITPPVYDSLSLREELYGRRSFPVVVTGTTSATINTASLVAHGIKDANGGAVDPTKLKVVAFPTSNAGQLYQGAVPTATQIDIRSAVASVPYIAFIFAV